MPKYGVPVRQTVVTTFEVEADSKEEAMHKVEEFPEDCKELSEVPGDPEVYYPDIEEIP